MKKVKHLPNQDSVIKLKPIEEGSDYSLRGVGNTHPTENTPPKNPYEENGGHEKFLTIGKQQSMMFFMQLHEETDQLQENLNRTEV